MDPDKQREIARLGGKAAHESGHAHEFDHSEAVVAGRKGGRMVSRDREHMAEIGRKGGKSSHVGGEGGASHDDPAGSRESSSHRARHAGGRSSSQHGEGGESTSGYGEKARAFIHNEIKHHVDDQGMPQDQAVAAAMSEARRKGYEVPDRR